jgi:hypothetical protein
VVNIMLSNTQFRFRRELLAILVILMPFSALAEVPPAKPYAQLVDEVMAFLVSDVGLNGIRTNDNDPDGYPVPPYFYSFAIDDLNNLDGRLVGYPGYLSVSYPAYTAAVAIDAFLDWRRWTGDDEGLTRARQYADWILEHRTHATDLYGNLPYSTQTDAVMGGGWDGPAIMPEKAPMFGLRLLRLYDITGEIAYLDGAEEIADVMAATQLTDPVEDDGRWPFRVVPADGTVTQDYTSHLTPAVRFFDDMAARTGNPVYIQTRDRTWTWLLANPCNSASGSFMRWEGFYEDQNPAMQTGKGDHYSGHEMIAELIKRRPAGWQDLAVTLLDSMSARYLVQGSGSSLAPYEPVTLEWTGWLEATYASSLQYARTALLLHQSLEGDPRQDDTWRQTALAMVAVCSHGQNTRGVAADGRMFTTIKDLILHFTANNWYEQNFNTVKYFLEIMALEPELAPDDETHILTADQALTSIIFLTDGALLEYATGGDSGNERIKVPGKPGAILAGGFELPELAGPPAGTPGWYYDTVTGVVSVSHDSNPVVVMSPVSAVEDPPNVGSSIFKLRSLGPVGAGRTVIEVDLPQGGDLHLAVYDLQGRLVRKLATGDRLPAGTHRIEWDGRDRHGRWAASGMYLVRGRSGAVTAGIRVVQVR